MVTSNSEIKNVALPKDGTVIVTTDSDVTEKEIFEDRHSIVQMLHSSYLNLTEEMAEFQQHWDDNPALAFVVSANEGWRAGSADWLNDQTELFHAKLWIDLGGKIKDAAGSAIDTMAVYATQSYEDITKKVNKHIENPEATLYNWAWWQASIETEAKERIKDQLNTYKQIEKSAHDAAVTMLETADKAKKIYVHRDAILGLPNLIAKGDPIPIQNFVDTILMDIDPELAKAIRRNPDFAIVLELIADHDSVLNYLAYVGLMLEAVPPNFYAYVAGKGGGYIMIEVVMLIVTSLLTAGTAAGTRIAMLVARFAATSAKVATVPRHLQKAKAAIEAFIDILKDLSQAINDLHEVSAKLLRARKRGLVIKGNSKSTLDVRKKSIKRDKKCRICGSTTHRTPHGHRAILEYQ